MHRSSPTSSTCSARCSGRIRGQEEGTSALDMPGARDEFVVLLGDALEGEEVPVAAVVASRIVTADEGARLVDGAAALLGIEETADAAEMLVRLAPHHPLVAVRRLEKPPLRLLE